MLLLTSLYFSYPSGSNLFFLRFSSVSLHRSPIQFCFAFFMHLLMLLLTSVYFSDPSGSNLFFLGSLLLSHRSRISAMTQIFVLTMFAKCQNYRTISIISHPSKVMLKIILNRLKPQAERFIAEEQAGFRAGRSTTEQIFNLRILCEKPLQHQQDLYHVFIDFKKASDRV